MGKDKSKGKAKSAKKSARPGHGAKASAAQAADPRQRPAQTVATASATVATGSVTPSDSSGCKLSALQLQFKKKLEGARFRTLNEQLYTCRGHDAYSKFQAEPKLFDVVRYILNSIFISFSNNYSCITSMRIVS